MRPSIKRLWPNQIRMPRSTWIAVLFSCVFFWAWADADFSNGVGGPDAGSRAEGDSAMVSSAHPLASEAGLSMIHQGGNAVDAAVATAFALNVVEPNMSGIGGGGSVLIWLDAEERVEYGDFYSAKHVDSYRNIDRAEDDEFNLLSTGVPGTVDGLLHALEHHGTLSRETVMQPAIDLATEGFPVYLTLAQFIEADSVKLNRYEGASRTFWPRGEPLAPGEHLIQPELAETLARIQQEGRSAFYEGEVAEAAVEVLNDGGNPVTLDDFANFESQWDKGALCGTYQGYTVLSAPPPQTGLQVINTLHLLDRYQLREVGLPTQSAEAFDIMTSALRVGMADRSSNISDPKWADVPALELISPAYANQRSESVGTSSVADTIHAGSLDQLSNADPAEACGDYQAHLYRNDWASIHEAQSSASQQDDDKDAGETTHISVVDPDGNAVSLSTTLSPVFGSGAWVKGFLLNTSGYNFEHMEDEEDWEGGHPYRVRASTISPTIILNENKDVELVIGAPGGGRIPTAIIQNIVYILDYGMDPLDAVRMPRVFPSANSAEVQIEGGFDSSVLAGTRSMGYDVQTLSPGYARMYLVSRQGDRWVGVSDPRHDGQPRGF